MNIPSSLLLLFFAVYAWASEASWPNEAFALYYAYRFECEGYGFANTYLANGCGGPKATRPCNMDEFLKYIVKGQWSGTTTLGDNPSLADAVKQIKNSGYAKMKYDPGRLYVALNRPTHAQIMQNVAKNMRSTISVLKGASNNWRDNCITKFNNAISDALGERQRENSKFMLSYLDGFFGKPVDRKKVTSPRGTVYDTIDTDEMVRKATTQTEKDKITDAVQDFQKGQSGGIKEKQHQKVINVLDSMKNIPAQWQASKNIQCKK